MTDADLMLSLPGLEFGTGIVGVCDVCGRRQAVIVLQKERFKLCVIDFLNKKWIGSSAKPGVPAPLYRSERVWFPTTTAKSGRVQAVVLSPTRVVKHPAVLITPDVHGLTTAILDGAIRLAQQGFEVLLPDVNLAGTYGPPQLFATRSGVWASRGVPLRSPAVAKLTDLYSDALAFVRTRPMVDPERSAVLGLSYGGALAVGVAARDPKLGAVVLGYPVPVSPPESLKLVTPPVLIVTGAKDRLGRKALGQFSAQLPKERFESFDAGNVGHDFLARDIGSYDVAAAEATWKRIGEFLARQLLPPPPRPPTPPAPAAPAAAPPRPTPSVARAAPPRPAPAKPPGAPA
jgi:dienelactone hydrolase